MERRRCSHSPVPVLAAIPPPAPTPWRPAEHADRTGRSGAHRRLPRRDALGRASRGRHPRGRGRRRRAGRATVAAELGVERGGVARGELFAAGIDGLVIAAATDAHAALVVGGVEAGLPTFCEKPVAGDVDGTLAVLDKVDGSRRARAHRLPAAVRRRATSPRVRPWRVRGARLRPHHPLRHPRPGAAARRTTSPTSGGFFRDCSVHDFDSRPLGDRAGGASRSTPSAPTAGADFFADGRRRRHRRSRC